MFLRTMLLFFLTLSALPGAQNFRLTPQTTITLTMQEDKSAEYGAKTLSRYLQHFTQKPLPLSHKRQKPESSEIILAYSDAPFLQKSPLAFRLHRLKEDGFILYVTGAKLYIIAQNRRALWYGIYHFLEHYVGYRFLSADYTYTPAPHTVELAPLLDIQEPAFAYREIFITESDDWQYATQNRLNGRLGHRTLPQYQDPRYPHGINIYNSFTPFALVPQKRFHCNGQLPFGNPAVQKLAAKTLGEKLPQLSVRPGDYLYIQHEDRNSFCPQDGNTPRQAASAFFAYGHYLAEHLPPAYANQTLLLEAYQWSRTPPASHTPWPKNTAVMFSAIEANFAKPLKDPQNAPIRKDLTKWAKLSEHLIVWHYTISFGGYFQPFPNLYALAEDIRDFASMPHIKGLFLQGCYETPKSEFANLRIWVFSKLLWNPNEDVDRLIKEFCRYYYGAAGEDVYRYIRTLHRITAKIDQKLQVKTPPNAPYLREPFLTQLEAILDTGAKKVRHTPLFKAHLDEVYANLDYIRLLNGTDSRKRKISQKRFKTFLQTHPDIRHYAEGAPIDSLLQIIEIAKQTPRPPKEAQGRTLGLDWYDFQEYTLKLCCTRIVRDPQASDKIAATMHGSQPEWGFQLDLNTNLPKGKWDIYARVKVTLKKQHTILDKSRVAFFFGIYPTWLKGAYLIAQLTPGVYKTVKLGTIDTQTTQADYLWISPPENNVVDKLYLDRIFVVKKD